MGSQESWDVRRRAPHTIVVNVEGKFYAAKRGGATQPDRTHGGIGPVVITYTTIGRPYQTERAAQSDAALALQRDEE